MNFFIELGNVFLGKTEILERFFDHKEYNCLKSTKFKKNTESSKEKGKCFDFVTENTLLLLGEINPYLVLSFLH